MQELRVSSAAAPGEDVIDCPETPNHPRRADEAAGALI